MAKKKEKKEAPSKDEKPEAKETDPKKRLAAVMASINKMYGPGTILRATEANSLIMSRVSSGIFDLDLRLGGGWPRGRISMLKGEYSAGKTVLCLMAVAQFQRCDRRTGKPFKEKMPDGRFIRLNFGREGEPEPMRVVWMDVEHSFDPSWAALWGVDPEQIHVIQTEYAEQAIDVADRCIRSRECDLLVCDSIAALAPGIEVEQTSEKWQVGVMARLMNKALRKWTSGMNSLGLLSETQCTILLINQMRLNLGSYVVSLTSPGGKGLDFYESVEIRLQKSDPIIDPQANRPVGLKVEYVPKKNKTAPLTSGGTFSLHFQNSRALGIKAGTTDTDRQVLDLAVYWGLIEKSGSWFNVKGSQTKYQGMDNLTAAVRTDFDLLEELQSMVLERERAWRQDGIAPEGGAGETTERFSTEDAPAEDVDS